MQPPCPDNPQPASAAAALAVSPSASTATDAGWHEVRFEPGGQVVRVPVGTKLLEAVQQAGLPIARGCGAEGLCSRCGVAIEAGAVAGQDAREESVKQRNRIDPQLRLACRVEVEDDLVIRASYW